MKNKIIEIGKKLDLKGFAPGISGNISARTDRGFLISGSGKKLSELSEDTIVEIDFAGNILDGSFKPSSEKNLHSKIYQLRPDINAIIHCHSPKTATLATCHIPMDKKLLADCVFYLKEIPLAPYALPGSEKLVENVAPLFENYHAVLLANHGIIIGAKDLDNAFYLAETAEFNAEVYINALSLNLYKSLSDKDVEEIYNLAK